jgi:hypothetical protein
MASNRKIISDVRGTHRLLSGDALINDRVILSNLNNVVRVLVRRELNLRKLTTTDSIYTVIPCLELEEVPISECGVYVDDCTIARTVVKLPNIEESNYFHAIQGVFSINNSKKLKEITPSRWINMLKLTQKINDIFFWIQNGYLYVTSPEVTTIKISAFFSEDVPLSLLYPTGCDACKCAPVNNDALCKNPLDNEFKCPGYLIDNVIRMTSEFLLRTYFHIPEQVSDKNEDEQAINLVKQSK